MLSRYVESFVPQNGKKDNKQFPRSVMAAQLSPKQLVEVRVLTWKPNYEEDYTMDKV